MRKLIFIIALIFVLPSFAARVEHLYNSDVVVASQSDTDRAQAVQNALKQVLIKVSGNTDIISAPGIQAGIQNANNYLQAYNYHNGTNATGQPALMLNAKFDGKAIKALLSQSQQPVWGSNRPLILVWLAVTKNQAAPFIASSANDVPCKNFLTEAAGARGLPILWPMLDLTDIQTITVNSITQADPSVIVPASKRYGGDAILAANLQQSATGQWTGHWMLISATNQEQQPAWDNSAADLQSLITAGINKIANSLAQRYAVVGTATVGNNNIELTIVNIQNLGNYADVTNYLKSLGPVKKVEVVQITPKSLVYDLQVIGGKEALQQSLSLDHRFQAVTNSANDPVNSNGDTSLVYQWNS